VERFPKQLIILQRAVELQANKPAESGFVKFTVISVEQILSHQPRRFAIKEVSVVIKKWLQKEMSLDLCFFLKCFRTHGFLYE